MIQAKNVHKHFGSVHAVRGVSFEIERGQVLGILGPNGAGKSTTIRMITGALPPSRGTISIDGLDTINHSLETRTKLGYLPEAAPFYPEMPVHRYLDYRARLFGLSRKRRRERLEVAIERCALEEMRRRPIGTLSKGYRQRVGLAAALIHDPPILILDEPTSGLDPAQIAETRTLIRDLAGDHTMLLVSHILPEVEKTCDRVLIFSNGTIRADGNPRTLVRDALGSNRIIAEVAAKASDGTPAVEIARALPGIKHVEHKPAKGDRLTLEIDFDESSEIDAREIFALAAQKAGLFVVELRPRTATLEELYIRLTSPMESKAAAS